MILMAFCQLVHLSRFFLLATNRLVRFFFGQDWQAV